MFPEAAQCLRTAAPLLPLCGLLTRLTRRGSHGGVGRVQARRHFGVSRPATAKVLPPRKPRERVEIPGLEMVTYGDRMHFVPGLSKPVNPLWVRDYKDPRYYKAPPAHQMALFREKPCFVYHQRTSALEGNGYYDQARAQTCWGAGAQTQKKGTQWQKKILKGMKH